MHFPMEVLLKSAGYHVRKMKKSLRQSPATGWRDHVCCLTAGCGQPLSVRPSASHGRGWLQGRSGGLWIGRDLRRLRLSCSPVPGLADGERTGRRFPSIRSGRTRVSRSRSLLDPREKGSRHRGKGKAKGPGDRCAGHGATVALAESIIEQFDKIQQCIEKETDALFNQSLGDRLNLSSESE